MKVKLSKSQWESVGKKMGWKKAQSLEWEAENYLISMSRMVENIRAMDKNKIGEIELKTSLLQRAFNLIADFQELAR